MPIAVFLAGARDAPGGGVPMNLREWALPLYTILLQLATGALLTLWVIRLLVIREWNAGEVDRLVKRPLLIILFTIACAMLGSHFHLSNPFISFLAILNLRMSWLSREILFTVLFFMTTLTLAALQWFRPGRRKLMTPLGLVAVGFGLASIYCMSRIYDLPVQAAWNSDLTTVSFYTTTLLLGVTSLPAMMLMDAQFQKSTETGQEPSSSSLLSNVITVLALVAGMLLLAVVAVNVVQIAMLQNGSTLARTSAHLLLDLYGPLFALRLASIAIGISVFIFAAWRLVRLHQPLLNQLGPIYLGFLLVMVGEILGRFLFYAMHIRQGV